MNWLMYIGGGIIWYCFGAFVLGYLGIGDKIAVNILLTCFLAIWIWICWKFIKKELNE